MSAGRSVTVNSLLSMSSVSALPSSPPPVLFVAAPDVPASGADVDTESSVSNRSRFEPRRNWFADSTVSSTSVTTYALNRCLSDTVAGLLSSSSRTPGYRCSSRRMNWSSRTGSRLSRCTLAGSAQSRPLTVEMGTSVGSS
uniref:Putative secreted protein n=1 Tax=Ixodes ricinus TaxID=34613 RepID=A0A6B0UTJ2_IXORI